MLNMRNLCPLFIILIIICGCVSNPSDAMTSPAGLTQLPYSIKDQSRIFIVPVLLPEDKEKDWFEKYFPSQDSSKRYEQNRLYTHLLSQKVNDVLNANRFISLTVKPVRAEDMTNPAFFDTLNVSYPSDYYILLYIYEITNSQKKIGRSLSYEDDGVYPMEQWEQQGFFRIRLELYEAAANNLIWQADLATNAIMINNKNISGTKSLDDLVSSLVLPDLYEKVNNKAIEQALLEITNLLFPLSVEINQGHKVKVDIFLYDRKASVDNILKGGRIKVRGLIPSKNSIYQVQEFVSDESGQTRIKLAEGFYDIHASIPSPDGRTRETGIQTLIIGNVRKINLVLPD